MHTKRKSTILDTINDITERAKSHGIAQQYAQNSFLDGRNIKIRNNNTLNFGSCSYLGLELDARLKEAAIKATMDFGIQFSSSRAYVSSPLYSELEEVSQKLFQGNVILSPTTTLGHQAAIPVLVQSGDAIIMDQQVHASVQYACKATQVNGIKVSVVRHNNLEQLEQLIIEQSKTHRNIWYMADGVYSMYGDFAPIHELVALTKKYDCFHIYLDDAHGMSWTGDRGQGYVLGQVPIQDKMIVALSFAKAFGTGGAALVFKDAKTAQKVRNCGGPLIFSGPTQIPIIAASIASAKIHLSDEIITLQQKLNSKINYCQKQLEYHNLPIVSNPNTPIFYVGLGLVRVGYNMISRMVNDGYYLNLGSFPAVPETCSGARFTISNHLEANDIKEMVETFAHHLPQVLQEEERTIKDIHRAFRKVKDFSEKEHTPIIPLFHYDEKLRVNISETIKDVNREDWNNLIATTSTFDWQGQLSIEESYRNNPKSENNWKFKYVTINDHNGRPIIMTSFTICQMKDDLFAPESISKQIAVKRSENPHYLTSKALVMGNLLSIGEHLYINKQHQNWKKALMLLLDEVWKIQDEEKTESIFFRDFDANDEELASFFYEQGFVQTGLPERYDVNNLNWSSTNEYLLNFNRKHRYNLKREVMRLEENYLVNIITTPTDLQLERYYELYTNVHEKSFELNSFKLPKRLFKNMFNHDKWEVIELRLISDPDKIVATAYCYNSVHSYGFLIVGLDYNYVETENSYKQAIWQTIKRANQLGKKSISLGLTAGMSKRKFGAKPSSNVAYIQIKDNYNHVIINSMADMA